MSTKTTYSVKRYRRDSDKEDAQQVIKACAIERAKVLNMQLQTHINASPTSILIQRDDYHGISAITRTPKSKHGRYGNGVVTYALDDSDTEYDRESIIHIIADRIEEGFYDDREVPA